MTELYFFLPVQWVWLPSLLKCGLDNRAAVFQYSILCTSYTNNVIQRKKRHCYGFCMGISRQKSPSFCKCFLIKYSDANVTHISSSLMVTIARYDTSVPDCVDRRRKHISLQHAWSQEAENNWMTHMNTFMCWQQYPSLINACFKLNAGVLPKVNYLLHRHYQTMGNPFVVEAMLQPGVFDFDSSLLLLPVQSGHQLPPHILSQRLKTHLFGIFLNLL